MGIDDLLKQMMDDELEDRMAGQQLARPIEYARSRGFAPQKVYAALRNHKLDYWTCNCGHRCVRIEEADEYFGIKRETDEDEDPITLQGASDESGPVSGGDSEVRD